MFFYVKKKNLEIQNSKCFWKIELKDACFASENFETHAHQGSSKCWRQMCVRKCMASQILSVKINLPFNSIPYELFEVALCVCYTTLDIAHSEYSKDFSTYYADCCYHCQSD